MGIVRFALRFPHTFNVLAALIVFLGVTAIRAMAPRPITRHPAAIIVQFNASSVPNASTLATSTRVSSPRLTPNWRPRRTAQAPRADFVLGADHVEFDVHVVTRRVRVGADLLVRLLDQLSELGLRQALVVDTHLHGEPEAATVARPD